MKNFILMVLIVAMITACDQRISNTNDNDSTSEGTADSQSDSAADADSAATNTFERIPYTGENPESSKLSEEMFLYLLFLSVTQENSQVVNLTFDFYQEWIADLNNQVDPSEVRVVFEQWKTLTDKDLEGNAA